MSLNQHPIAPTPSPPYYAVVFTSQRNDLDAAGYAAAADRMVELAAQQPGFLGVESVRQADGTGITVSYWSSLEAIRNWKRHVEHVSAQERGRTHWYRQYRVRVCRVERDYGFDAGSSDAC
jgi:heme-degrading monooxygenase HmoA